ncbi:MAG: FliA/WhiG family RNA polymerase sigma factor [Planctomycetes bacterium]|nr:FliA/WhiG family RNA polymerase sigma factor [Planctomycetota bacterium]
MIEVDEKLWQRYREGDQQAFEDLITAYLPLVKITVGRIAVNLPNFIDYEELYSTGCVGLLDAIRRYNPAREAKFTSYAITRIRGEVLDELRHNDLLGRVTRDRVTRIREAENKLLRKGKPADSQEIAREAKLSMNEYYDAIMGERATRMISLSEVVASEDKNQTLADVLESKNLMVSDRMPMEDEEILTVVQEMLDDREKTLVLLYYHDGLTLKEIGAILGVSESRISQIHAEMLERVRKNLKKIGI